MSKNIQSNVAPAPSLLNWQISKDAGFVYESLGIEMNRVIWDFCFHETNPRYKSLRFGFANPDSQICNFRICKDSDSRISIFKESFRAIVLRIRKDLWKQVKSFENQSTKQIHETNLLKTWRIRDPRYKTNPWIRKTNPRFYKSLIRIPHPYKKHISY